MLLYMWLIDTDFLEVVLKLQVCKDFAKPTLPQIINTYICLDFKFNYWVESKVSFLK